MSLFCCIFASVIFSTESEFFIKRDQSFFHLSANIILVNWWCLFVRRLWRRRVSLQWWGVPFCGISLWQRTRLWWRRRRTQLWELGSVSKCFTFLTSKSFENYLKQLETLKKEAFRINFYNLGYFGKSTWSVSECIGYQFDCGDGQCLFVSLVCDETPNCDNGKDEQNCNSKKNSIFSLMYWTV